MVRRSSLMQVQNGSCFSVRGRNGVIKILAGEDLYRPFWPILPSREKWCIDLSHEMTLPSDVPNRNVCVRVNEIFTAIYDQWVSVGFRFRRELERHFMFRNSGQRSTYTRKSIHLSCALSEIYFFFSSFVQNFVYASSVFEIHCLIKKKNCTVCNFVFFANIRDLYWRNQ